MWSPVHLPSSGGPRSIPTLLAPSKVLSWPKAASWVGACEVLASLGWAVFTLLQPSQVSGACSLTLAGCSQRTRTRGLTLPELTSDLCPYVASVMMIALTKRGFSFCRQGNRGPEKTRPWPRSQRLWENLGAGVPATPPQPCCLLFILPALLQEFSELASWKCMRLKESGAKRRQYFPDLRGLHRELRAGMCHLPLPLNGTTHHQERTDDCGDVIEFQVQSPAPWETFSLAVLELKASFLGWVPQEPLPQSLRQAFAFPCVGGSQDLASRF